MSCRLLCGLWALSAALASGTSIADSFTSDLTPKKTPGCWTESVTYVDDEVTKNAPNGAFVAKASDCQSMCAASVSCKTFTYRTEATRAGVKPALAKGACYLFKAGKMFLREEGAVSGPRVCPGQKRWNFPFNITFPAKWLPEPDPSQAKEKKGDKTIAQLLKEAWAASKEQSTVSSEEDGLKDCAGPMCCPKSTCHHHSPCNDNRGQTRCVGAAWLPFKFGTCECLSGACNSRGLCHDSPLLQEFEKAPRIELLTGPSISDDRSWHQAAVGASALLVTGSLAAGVLRLARRRPETERPPLESGLME